MSINVNNCAQFIPERKIEERKGYSYEIALIPYFVTGLLICGFAIGFIGYCLVKIIKT